MAVFVAACICLSDCSGRAVFVCSGREVSVAAATCRFPLGSSVPPPREPLQF
ncbi:hypothetical protein [Methanimicrococcus hongohii]|uniref:hypothetical protein n=1 Tax=Methanimicrococcus hongohii TaxID=3028295 RepID=UPI00292D3950|nr:hypothetical protein [Methanimicrococcus sp. Hf6]